MSCKSSFFQVSSHKFNFEEGQKFKFFGSTSQFGVWSLSDDQCLSAASTQKLVKINNTY